MYGAGGRGTVVLMRWTWSPTGAGPRPPPFRPGGPGAHRIKAVGKTVGPGREFHRPAANAGHLADDRATGQGHDGTNHGPRTRAPARDTTWPDWACGPFMTLGRSVMKRVRIPAAIWRSGTRAERARNQRGSNRWARRKPGGW